MTLRKARVVAVHPDKGTVDLVFLDNGQRMVQVEVMGDSSTSGCSWRTPNVPLPSSEGAAASVEGSMRNLVAYCGTAYGMPVVIGFSRPINGLTPSEQNRWLDVHDVSGSYMTFAPDGSYEVFIPGGGVLRIGTGGHQDVSGLLARGTLPAAGPGALTVTLATSSGTLSLNPSGSWSLTGAHLAIGCDTSLTGTLTVSGDVIVAGRSFNGHKHGGVQSGGSQTSPPV